MGMQFNLANGTEVSISYVEKVPDVFIHIFYIYFALHSKVHVDKNWTTEN